MIDFSMEGEQYYYDVVTEFIEHIQYSGTSEGSSMSLSSLHLWQSQHWT